MRPQGATQRGGPGALKGPRGARQASSDSGIWCTLEKRPRELGLKAEELP